MTPPTDLTQRDIITARMISVIEVTTQRGGQTERQYWTADGIYLVTRLEDTQ